MCVVIIYKQRQLYQSLALFPTLRAAENTRDETPFDFASCATAPDRFAQDDRAIWYKILSP
jgi:hypothetical protein